MSRSEALRQFSVYYGFDDTLLTGDDCYTIVQDDAAFDGQVAAIRLTENGRFGNVFWQILHAALLSRQLNIQAIELFPFLCGPREGQYEIAGLQFSCQTVHRTSKPTLVGHFFNSYPFQSALTGFGAETAVQVVDNVMRPLFRHLFPAADPIGQATLVMNLRGGDVFSGQPVPAWYVQPPSSYYLRAATYAREHAGVDHVLIVAEDRLNPALPVLERALSKEGFRLDFQSASLAEDLRVLMRAQHLASPFGTFCEAVAMLSTSLRTYFAFRQFESHRHQHTRRPALLTKVLQAHGVRAVRISDALRDYIPPRSWQATEAQIDLIRSFPVEHLALQDLNAEPDASDDCFESYPPGTLPSASVEACALRQSLLQAREQLSHAQQQLAERDEELRTLRTSRSWKALLLRAVGAEHHVPRNHDQRVQRSGH